MLVLSSAERDRVEALLPAADTVVVGEDPAAFWGKSGHEPGDLLVIDAAALPDDPAAAREQVQRLPGEPEAVVLVAGEDAGRAVRLQGAGFLVLLRAGDAEMGQALLAVVERRRRALDERLAVSQSRPLRLGEFVSQSAAAQKLYRLAGRVAVSDTSLLLLGETGTGKDWLARAIHGESPRAAGPFIPVNCGAMPDSLLESELFGYERGAFTGAAQARRGYFELAHRGTLYLDEIGEMPLHLQVKLLRVLQDRRIQRLGSERAIEVDVRIIAATNRDLVAAVKDKTFRQDLYYRLAVVTLQLPALRERREDIPELVATYFGRNRTKLARYDLTEVTPAAMAALVAYDWPGNVRELINVVERAVLLSEGPRVDLTDLPPEICGPGPGRDRSAAPPPEGAGVWDGSLEQPLDAARQVVVARFEREYLVRLLTRHRGNVGRTAREAGIDPRTLYNKMRQLGLRKEEFKNEAR
jgi:DNA-binding NtrC family response regulator